MPTFRIPWNCPACGCGESDCDYWCAEVRVTPGYMDGGELVRTGPDVVGWYGVSTSPRPSVGTVSTDLGWYAGGDSISGLVVEVYEYRCFTDWTDSWDFLNVQTPNFTGNF